MCKTLFAAIIAFAVLSTAPAYAQFGNCTTQLGPCASLPQQLLDYARQAEQLIQETTTAEQEIINTLKVPGQLFRDASGDITHMLDIAASANLLFGNTFSFINNLHQPGLFPAAITADPLKELVRQENAVSDAVHALGNAINVDNPLIADRTTIFAALSAQNMTDAGRLQALQQANQVGATTGQQLQSLETILLAMAQGQHTQIVAARDREAMQDESLFEFSAQWQLVPTTGWHGF